MMQAAAVTRCLAAGMLVSLSSASVAADWRLLTTDDRSKVYVEASSIKAQPGWRLAWIRIDTQAQRVVLQLVVDCTNNLVTPIRHDALTGMKTKRRIVPDPDDNLARPKLALADSITEAISTYVCAVESE